MSKLYIGLMSGTSADGIDAVLVDFSANQPQLIGSHYFPYDHKLKQMILALCHPGADEIQRLGELDVMLANRFADAVNELLAKSSTSADDIIAIGSHGQTIRHAPLGDNRFTIQIGDPNTIAAKTGITTVADFRRKDVALGGQGAPLVPAFHHNLFADENIDRAVVNIGGIANVTLLPRHSDKIIGFDTGPGNTLMDFWIHTHLKETHDQEGAWGARGIVNQKLLKRMLADIYFSMTPPKSTGREYFHAIWLEQQLKAINEDMKPIDVQATLAELTAESIANDIKKNLNGGEILVCGGGAHNKFLLSRLQELTAPAFTVKTTESYGVHPDWVEAIAFAWLAWQTMEKRTGNVPSVTGASQAAILGGVYYA